MCSAPILCSLPPQHDVRRIHTGACVTSLDMQGVSLTLMACDEARLKALDAPTTAVGWPTCGGPVAASKPLVPIPQAVLDVRERKQLRSRPLSTATPEGRTMEAAVRAAAAALQKAAARLNELDSKAGDGDTGDTVATAAAALAAAPEGCFAGTAPETLQAVAAIVRSAVGGSLGGLYNLGIGAAAAALPAGPANHQAWASAMSVGLQAVMQYGNAKAGSRTMLDALLPACDALAKAAAEGRSAPEAARAAAAAAAAGAEQTRGMVATAGRASYTRGAALADADPGAVGVAIWLDAVAAAIESQSA